MLRDHQWKGVYRSENDNLLEDFYLPALYESTAYDRAVGYFSAAMLSYAAQGITALLENDGQMRLIFGGELEERDAAAINEGYDVREYADKLGYKIIGQIDNIAEVLANQRLTALSWLIANGRLDIKIALKRRGMYHEKIGIFKDSTGDKIVFQGSANETVHALLPDFNFESVNVFPSWRSELADHYIPYVDGFERLWNNKTNNTVVIDFPVAAKDRLIKIAKRSKQPTVIIELDTWNRLKSKKDEDLETYTAENPEIPVTINGQAFEIRDHQRDALNAWRAREFQGILAMATGSGKTLTAIYGAVRLFEKYKRLFLVIAVPYQSLGDQWVNELALFNIGAIPCYESTERWGEKLSRTITIFQSGALKFAACVVVNRTLQSTQFQGRLTRIPGDRLMFVGDECHNHASEALSKSLPKQARLRLGLSATPKHYFDHQRTQRLITYYGDVAYEYSLEDALTDGVLTPYRYYIHLVEMTDDEADEYIDLSHKINRIAAGQSAVDVEDSSDDQLKLLLFKRSRLLGNAKNKLDKFRKLLVGKEPSPFHLFYCGDGKVEDAKDDSVRRQVDQVSSILYENGWKVSHFTARETRKDRLEILDNFRIGTIEGLVAIRCLDEGIDIPDCRCAYILASSRNPKQFIQRRGRILRRSPGKEYAEINDFLIMLPSGCADSKLERDIFRNELSRIAEFANLCTNYSDVFNKISSLLREYDLTHYLA